MPRLQSFLSAVVAAALLLCSTASAGDVKVDPAAMKVAEAYLDALSGKGDDAGRDLLLGGATMTAQLFILENWKIVEKEPLKLEEGDLGSASRLMGDLDKAGREALTKLMDGDHGDGMQVQAVSQAEASQLMAPTRERSQRFLKAHPVLAFATRVGKEVYWHPQNPMRPLLARAGSSGKYKLELYRFKILTTEGPRKVPREWPLRVLRFRAGKLDTGWRVLPASDWNAE